MVPSGWADAPLWYIIPRWDGDGGGGMLSFGWGVAPSLYIIPLRGVNILNGYINSPEGKHIPGEANGLVK